jgi:hypothetical protein
MVAVDIILTAAPRVPLAALPQSVVDPGRVRVPCTRMSRFTNPFHPLRPHSNLNQKNSYSTRTRR